MITVSVKGDKELIQRFDEMPMALQAVLLQKTQAMAIDIQADVVSQKLHGQVLNQRSGALARSIQQEATSSDLRVTGRVFSSGDVKYAAIHEYGGTIKSPGGTAYIPGIGKNGLAAFISNAAASQFTWNGKELPRTQPHEIPMPERSFLRSTLAEWKARIIQSYQEAPYVAYQRTMTRALSA